MGTSQYCWWACTVHFLLSHIAQNLATLLNGLPKEFGRLLQLVRVLCGHRNGVSTTAFSNTTLFDTALSLTWGLWCKTLNDTIECSVCLVKRVRGSKNSSIIKSQSWVTLWHWTTSKWLSQWMIYTAGTGPYVSLFFQDVLVRALCGLEHPMGKSTVSLSVLLHYQAAGRNALRTPFMTLSLKSPGFFYMPGIKTTPATLKLVK